MIVRDWCSIEGLAGRWATNESSPLVSLAPRRLSDRLQSAAGSVGWFALRWYPVLLLMYSGGVAAVAGGRYDNLREVFDSRVATPRGEESLVEAVVGGLSDIADQFKLLPGHDRQYAARSEYLHKL